MGMDLMNPPTVEGWHTGHEWIDSGTLVERINFAAEYLGRTDLPGVDDMTNRLMDRGAQLSPEAFVDGCIDMLGCDNVSADTRQELLAHAQRGGELRLALLLVGDPEKLLVISGNGDVIEPEHEVAAIGSGGSFALAAARALVESSNLDARAVVERALNIAADICIYTNRNLVIEELK